MNNTIKELNSKRAEALKVIEICDTSLKALRQLCTHDWYYVGHGHNSIKYECSICGEVYYE